MGSGAEMDRAVQVARTARLAALIAVVWFVADIARTALPDRFGWPVTGLALSVAGMIVASVFIAERAATRR